jgi:hypothetical protein
VIASVGCKDLFGGRLQACKVSIVFPAISYSSNNNNVLCQYFSAGPSVSVAVVVNVGSAMQKKLHNYTYILSLD